MSISVNGKPVSKLTDEKPPERPKDDGVGSLSTISINGVPIQTPRNAGADMTINGKPVQRHVERGTQIVATVPERPCPFQDPIELGLFDPVERYSE